MAHSKLQRMFLKMKTDDLIKERANDYGDTWLIVGQICRGLAKRRLFDRLLATPYSHNWYLMMSKMVRILFSPNKIDHWQDIEAYAKLVVGDLQKGA